MKKSSLIMIIVLLAISIIGCSRPAAETPVGAAELPSVTESPSGQVSRLTLATTTSTEDSGLLQYLLPDFEQRYNVKVDVIAVGTGQALKLGEDGNADVLLVHAPALEEAYMAAGHGLRHEPVMYNDFVILGPASDPAGIANAETATDALQLIAQNQSEFISRGDNSGTHAKELSLWKAAGLEPSGGWYISAGQGMGAILTMANEQMAYTLSDRATYLARSLTGLDLFVLAEGDPLLFNPYGVISVDPAKNPQIQGELADLFIEWIISMPTQELISQFGVDQFGQALFIPDSEAWRAAH
jgi:tungstate transport system substrate-binding protein